MRRVIFHHLGFGWSPFNKIMDKKSLAANITNAKEERRRFENLKNILTEAPESVQMPNFRSTKSLDKTQKIGQLKGYTTQVTPTAEQPLVKSNSKVPLMLADDSSEESVNDNPNVITLQVNQADEIHNLKSNLKLLSKGELISMNKKLLHNLKNMMEKAKTVAEDSCGALKQAYEAKLEKAKRKISKLNEKLEAANRISKQASGKADKAKSKLMAFQEEYKMLDKKYLDILSKLSSGKDDYNYLELALNKERARNAELESELSAFKKHSISKDSATQESMLNLKQLRESLHDKSEEIRGLKEQIAQLNASLKSSEQSVDQVLSLKQELDLLKTSYSSVDVF